MEELIRRTAGLAVSLEVVGSVGLWLTLVDPLQLENGRRAALSAALAIA